MPTDRRTERTDRPSHRDARTHLKTRFQIRPGNERRERWQKGLDFGEGEGEGGRRRGGEKERRVRTNWGVTKLTILTNDEFGIIIVVIMAQIEL